MANNKNFKNNNGEEHVENDDFKGEQEGEWKEVENVNDENQKPVEEKKPLITKEKAKIILKDAAILGSGVLIGLLAALGIGHLSANEAVEIASQVLEDGTEVTTF